MYEASAKIREVLQQEEIKEDNQNYKKYMKGIMKRIYTIREVKAKKVVEDAALLAEQREGGSSLPLIIVIVIILLIVLIAFLIYKLRK